MYRSSVEPGERFKFTNQLEAIPLVFLSEYMSKVKRRTTCRLCDSSSLTPVLELEPTPIGDEYISEDRLSTPQESYPLTVYQCSKCGHAQLLDIVSADALFRNYTFTTSSSGGLIDHFRRYVEDVVTRLTVEAPRPVVEIGSNDGSFLRFFKERGFDVLGVDPAIKIAKEATASGIETLPEFFTQTLARTIVSSKGKAALVCANNVYAHADDLIEITRGVKELLAPDGVFIFEVSYLVDILEKRLFDTIYHEHLCYHSIAPFVTFFHSLGLELFDVQRIPTKGGSIRCFVQLLDGPRPTSDRVADLLKLEAQRGVHTPKPFQELAAHLGSCRVQLNEMLLGYKRQGKKIAGFGASVTATTLLYHFKLQPLLDCIVDDNKSKEGLYSPQAHIPVFSSEILYDAQRKPDVLVILAWAYSSAIIKRHTPFIESGGVVLTPLPTVEKHVA
jgi:SAM-dependent methyltransferase